MAKNKPGISFLKDSSYLLLTRLSITLANIFVFAYFSHQLSVTENGSYLNFYVRISILSIVACGGLSMLLYSYSINTIKALYNRIKAGHIFRYSLFFLAVSALFAFLHFYDKSNHFTPVYLAVLLVYFITYSVNLITDALIIIGRKEKWLVIVNLAYSIIFVGVHIAILFSGFDLFKIIAALSALSLLKLFLNFNQTNKIFRRTDASQASEIHSAEVKKYWAHVFFFDLSQVVFRLADKFFITLVVAASVSAVYINGTFDIPFIPLIFAAVGNTALIKLNEQRDKSNKDISDSVRHTSQLMSTIVLPLFIFLFIFREEFIVFFFSDKYLASVPIFALSLFKILSYLFSVPFVFQLKQEGKVLNGGIIIDVITSLGLLYPLYYWLGLEGVIASFVAGTLLQTAYYIFQSARILHIKFYDLFPLGNWIIKSILYSAITAIAYLLAQHIQSDFVKLIIGGLPLFFISCFLLYLEFYKGIRLSLKAKTK